MIPSTPAFSAILVRTRLSAVLYEPVPATTAAWPATASLTATNSLSFSSLVSTGASPVVPETTIPSEPVFTR